MFATLRPMKLFKSMSDAHLLELAEHMSTSKHDDGDVLVKNGKQGKRENDELFVILDGKVSVTTKPESPNQVAIERTLSAGEIFGLITFLNGGARTATCKAAGPVSVASLSHGDYEKLLKLDPPLAGELLFLLASQLARDIRACNAALVKAMEKTAAPAKGAK